jgi:DNA polymerase III alpha subunit (gram-positive type)
MRKNNWWDHLFNNHHYDFAYAYAEVDPVIEDKTEEEELFKQFFEFRIGKFFRRITRPFDRVINYVKKKVVNTVKDVTGVTKAEGEARKAYQEAAKQQKEAQAEFDRVTKETTANIKSREAAYLKQRKEGEAKVSSARSAQTAAAARAVKAKKEGAANVAYATKQTAATKSRIQSEKAAKAAQLAAAQKKAALKVKTAKAPGVSGTVVKAIGGLAGTGKTGSAKGKTKGVKDKPGKLLIG